MYLMYKKRLGTELKQKRVVYLFKEEKRGRLEWKGCLRS